MYRGGSIRYTAAVAGVAWPRRSSTIPASGNASTDSRPAPTRAGHLVAVDAGTNRVLTSGPDGLRALCIGGVPGGAYERPDWSSADA